ncbi:MAG TPA: hypothetical protein VHN18_20935 [Micromonosporaceae bacterium]|nr:hypothetical protein [Micromonosporaceae bacterium]
MAAVADGPDEAHGRPRGVDDATVVGLGKLSEALETVERARGHLYSLHQLIGRADLMLDEAVDDLRGAGHEAIAARIREELIGRNVIAGRWTFQIVEDFDDGYYATFRRVEAGVRDELVGGRRHLFEAEMKECRRSRGRSGHEARPTEESP